MTHLFRPAEPSDGSLSPSWKAWRGLLYVAARVALARLRGLFSSQHGRRLVAYLALVLGLVVQVVMVLTAAYLVDLSISLMELWAELARKHLEITL